VDVVFGARARELDGAELVINLAGRSVNCRYTLVNGRDIKESRVRTTHPLSEAIAQALPEDSPSRLFIFRLDATGGWRDRACVTD